MRHVAIKIPYECEPLMLASEMLAEMAGGLAADIIDRPTGVAPDGTITTGTVSQGPTTEDADREARPRVDDTSPGLPDEMPNAADVFQGAAAFNAATAAVDAEDAAAPPPPPPPAGAAKTDDPQTNDPLTSTPTPMPGVDLDAAGLPWDSRIHAGSKKQLKDGTWKRRRGVDVETLNAVEAELTELMSISATLPGIGAVAESPAVPPPPPPPPADAPAAGPVTFPDLMLRITRDAVAPERVAEVLATHGIGSLPLLGKRSDLVPQVYADLFPVAG